MRMLKELNMQHFQIQIVDCQKEQQANKIGDKSASACGQRHAKCSTGLSSSWVVRGGGREREEGRGQRTEKQRQCDMATWRHCKIATFDRCQIDPDTDTLNHNFKLNASQTKTCKKKKKKGKKKLKNSCAHMSKAAAKN